MSKNMLTPKNLSYTYSALFEPVSNNHDSVSNVKYRHHPLPKKIGGGGGPFAAIERFLSLMRHWLSITALSPIRRNSQDQ